jgi:hypothetical protein
VAVAAMTVVPMRFASEVMRWRRQLLSTTMLTPRQAGGEIRNMQCTQ